MSTQKLKKIPFTYIMTILFSLLPVTHWHSSAFLQRDGELLGEFRREYCCLPDATQRACWTTTVILESVKTPLALRKCWRHRKGAVGLKGFFPSGDSPNDQAERELRGEKAQAILWGQLPLMFRKLSRQRAHSSGHMARRLNKHVTSSVVS